MNELIKVSLDQNNKQVVSARELHSFLGNPDNVNTWFKRQAERAMLEEGLDFIAILQESTGGRPSVDYALSLSSAKEIAMLNGGDKGKQARLYFIECERRLQGSQIAIPQTLSEALMLAANLAKQNEEQKMALTEAKPKVDYFNRVANTDSTFDLSEVAKNLKLPYGRNILFRTLRDRGVLMKDNSPYQKYIDAKYFELNQSMYQTADGKSHVVFQTRVTDKGMKWLAKNLT